ncbi:hypothetical protein BH23CHL5_BH23CHL5_03860 [soil metagenome]
MDKSEQHIRRIVVERMDRCSVCHRSFNEADVEVLSRKDDMWMMIVQCQDCHARSFVAAEVVDGSSASGSGHVDFAAARAVHDQYRPAESEAQEDRYPSTPVDVDDVLRMHEFLDVFDGDFRKLFSS